MRPIKVALLQMTGCAWDRDASLAKGELFCRSARARGADIALFPEMWSAGYTFFDAKSDGERERWRQQAISRDDSFVTHFRKLAAELNMAIALTGRFIRSSATVPASQAKVV